jgi:hypothetical protein
VASAILERKYQRKYPSYFNRVYELDGMKPESTFNPLCKNNCQRNYPCRKGGVMETFMSDFIVVSTYSVDIF